MDAENHWNNEFEFRWDWCNDYRLPVPMDELRRAMDDALFELSKMKLEKFLGMPIKVVPGLDPVVIALVSNGEVVSVMKGIN